MSARYLASGIVLLGWVDEQLHTIAPYTKDRYIQGEATYHLAKGGRVSIKEYITSFDDEEAVTQAEEILARLLPNASMNDMLDVHFMRAFHKYDVSITDDDINRKIDEFTAKKEFFEETGINIDALKAGMYDGVSVLSHSQDFSSYFDWNDSPNDGLSLDVIVVDNINGLKPHLKALDRSDYSEFPAFKTLHSQFVEALHQMDCPAEYIAMLDTPEKFLEQTKSRTNDRKLFDYIKEASKKVKQSLYNQGILSDSVSVKLDDFKISPLHYYREGAEIVSAEFFINAIRNFGIDSERGPVIGYRQSMLGDGNTNNVGQLDAFEAIIARVQASELGKENNKIKIWGWCKSPESKGHIGRLSKVANSLIEQQVDFTLFTDSRTEKTAQSVNFQGDIQILTDVPTSKPVPGQSLAADLWQRRDQAINQRIKELKAAYDRDKPDAIVIEFWPTGNNTHDRELIEFLDYAKADNPDFLIYHLGRDVPGPANPDFIVDTLNNYFTKSLCFGDKMLVDLANLIPGIEQIEEAGGLVYVGYPNYCDSTKTTASPKEREFITFVPGSTMSAMESSEESFAIFEAAGKNLENLISAFPNKKFIFIIPNDLPEERIKVVEKLKKAALELGYDEVSAGHDSNAFIQIGPVIIQNPLFGNEFHNILNESAVVITKGGSVTIEAVQAGAGVVSIPVGYSEQAEQKKRVQSLVEHPQKLAIRIDNLPITQQPELLTDAILHAYNDVIIRNPVEIASDGASKAASIIHKDIISKREYSHNLSDIIPGTDIYSIYRSPKIDTQIIL